MKNLNSIRTVLIVLFFCTFSFLSSAQLTVRQVRNLVKTASEQELLVQHSTYLIEGYLFNSDIIADRLVEFQPDNGNYLYRKGYTLMEVHRDYEGAIKLFEKAAEKVDNRYDMFSTKETSAPTDVYFHLAACYHYNEQIDEAIQYYQKFIDESKKKSELIALAELRLLQCAEAKRLMANPVSILLKNIGSAVNTEAPEFSPAVSLDGSALYFTSRRPWENGATSGENDIVHNLPPEDVYVSYLDFESEWTAPTRLKFCSPTRNEATSAVSTDERRLYLYLDSTGGGDLYYTDFYKASFDKIQKLESNNVNTKYWETHGMVSHDKQKLYFVSDRPGGFGGRDLYYCVLLPNNEWSKAVNMGSNVNTPYDEDAPFISIDNKTLYYSSNGPQSMGGFDIMQSILIEEGVWSNGINLGYPFNSTNDDIFYTTTVDGLKGYMTSYRKNGFGEKDIYEIKNDYLGVQNIAVLQGEIKSATDQPLSQDVVVVVDINCVDCNENENHRIFPRVRDGFYLSGLDPCKEYKIDYRNLTDSTTIYTERFTTSCDTGYQLVEMVLLVNPDYSLFVPEEVIQDSLLPLDTTTVVTVVEKPEFPNFDFKQFLGFNKNRLKTNEGELNAFLKNIENQLREGREEITIRIYASASTVPTQSFASNEALANKRAANVEEALKAYFAKTSFKKQVKIEIVEALVQGPAYSGDPENEKKYGAFQYVALDTK